MRKKMVPWCVHYLITRIHAYLIFVNRAIGKSLPKKRKKSPKPHL